MKIKKALEQGIKKLEEKNINSASLDAELLLSSILKKGKEFLYTHPEDELNFWQKLKYKKLIKKRATHYPIAYILGYKEFYGLKFLVNKDVLIPRPDTELLVQETLRLAKTKDNIVEIGTGSGCVAISLVKNGINHVTATDISNSALKIAQKNAKLNQIEEKITFLQGNLLKPVKGQNIDILIVNLPYLDKDYKYLIKGSDKKSLNFEPQNALYSGKDGLDGYRELFQQIKDLKHLPKYILIELDPEQVKLLSPYILNIFPQSNIETKKDLKGLDRVMIVKLS